MCPYYKEQGFRHKTEGCPYNHDAIKHFLICECCKLEENDFRPDGTRHQRHLCPSNKHYCCSWNISIVQTELWLMKDMGADPTEYSSKNKELQEKFFHGFTGVDGPYTPRRRWIDNEWQ